jgi:hypothetical protein
LRPFTFFAGSFEVQTTWARFSKFTWRHDAEIGEGGLAPAQEGIALAVALVFQLDILLEGAGTAEIIHHHRMVDDQIDGGERIDLLRVAAQGDHRLAHRRQIDHGGDAGEILHQHTRRAIGDLAVGALGLQPFGDGLDVGLGDRAPVFVAQQILQQHLQRVGQAGKIAQASLLRRLQAEIIIALAPDLEGLARFETVDGHGGYSQKLRPRRDQRNGTRKRRRARRPAAAGRDPGGQAPQAMRQMSRVPRNRDHNMSAAILRDDESLTHPNISSVARRPPPTAGNGTAPITQFCQIPTLFRPSGAETISGNRDHPLCLSQGSSTGP